MYIGGDPYNIYIVYMVRVLHIVHIDNSGYNVYIYATSTMYSMHAPDAAYTLPCNQRVLYTLYTLDKFRVYIVRNTFSFYIGHSVYIALSVILAAVAVEMRA